MITPAHPIFPYFREKVSEMAKKGNVVDMGTPRSFNKEMSYFAHLFGENYRSMGYAGNPGVETDLKGDIMALAFPDDSLDGVICLSVFPSLKDPVKGAGEIHRVLMPGGLFLGTFPFLVSYYAIKGGTDPYPDYWRFTHEGLQTLFAGFRRLEVKAMDGAATVRYKFLPSVFNRMTRFAWFNGVLDALDRRIESPGTTGFIVFGEK